jgi:hypothetical protein
MSITVARHFFAAGEHALRFGEAVAASGPTPQILVRKLARFRGGMDSNPCNHGRFVRPECFLCSPRERSIRIWTAIRAPESIALGVELCLFRLGISPERNQHRHERAPRSNALLGFSPPDVRHRALNLVAE